MFSNISQNYSMLHSDKYSGSRGPNSGREGEKKGKTWSEEEAPLASAVKNLSSVWVYLLKLLLNKTKTH